MFNEALAGKHGGNHNPTGVNQHTAGMREDKTDNVSLDQNKQHRNTHGNSKGYTSRRLLKERPERLGELLKDMPKAKGTRGIIQPGMDGAGGSHEAPPADPTLSDLGISKKLSSKCQKLSVLTLFRDS